MFGFLDKETPAIAERLFARASNDAARLKELGPQKFAVALAGELPADHISVTSGDVFYFYPDLPEFSFAVQDLLGGHNLTVQAGGRFNGFMLQFPAEHGRPTIHLSRTARAPIRPKGQRLSDYIERTFDVGNPAKTLARFARQYR